ncbi:MAG: MutS-related protein [Terriglobales bacterium]
MSAAEEYEQRLKAREASAAQHQKIHIRLGNLRLALVIVAAVMAWVILRGQMFSLVWLLVPTLLFVVVTAYHSRVLRALDLAQRAAAYYRKGLAQIADQWPGTGQTGERFDDPHHVYASDLDLFRRGGLFELLSAARTRMGEETLAQWLLSPSSLDQVRGRHLAVAELRPQLDLAESLAVLGEDAKVGVHPEALIRWAEAPNRLGPQWLRWLAPALAAAAIGGVVIWAFWGMATPLVLVVIVEAVLTYRLRHPLADVLHGTEQTFHGLALLSGMLKRLEHHSFQSPRLQALQRDLLSHHMPGSRALARLETSVDLIDSRDHFIVRTLDAPLMYSVQVALAAERWRRAHGHAVRSWVNAIGEIEALLSFATYSYEHPEDPFPEFVEGDAFFDGIEIGHPLVPSATCIRNDVGVGGDTRALLVSGSNMSGKSTLLRSVGINVVLAMAGAPVRARSLRLTPLCLGASIRINDSLQEGSSRFYAEITRLRKIFDLAGGQPALMFLLDELLQGTNSKDRRIGAEGVVRALVERGAIGLISTHDLALTEIGGLPEGHLHNVHFQDEFENGKMQFDYRLREGVVTKSNGLELMRSIGLDV